MAFVRWRGNSAELVTTIYDQGRSRQLHLAALGCMRCVYADVRADVAARFPQVPVDWDAVDLALAQGPPAHRPQGAASPPNDRLEWLQLERRLRYWAGLTEPVRTREAVCLRAAAALLSDWRHRSPYFPLAEPAVGWDQGLPPDDVSPAALTDGPHHA